MRTFVATLTAALLGLVLLAGPASAGLQDCTVTPGASGEGECLLVIGDDDGTTVTGADALPRTGGDSLPLVQMGVVLIALGGLVVLVVRKRGDAEN